MSKEFISATVADYLKSLGLPHGAAQRYGIKASDYFESSVCNSRDPFKESCDFAGKMAEREVKSFKYKSPRSQVRRRNKRPQEAFNFDN